MDGCPVFSAFIKIWKRSTHSPQKRKEKNKKRNMLVRHLKLRLSNQAFIDGWAQSNLFCTDNMQSWEHSSQSSATSTVDLECTDIYNCRHHFATIHMHAAYSIILADEFDRSRRKITNWWGHKATSSPLARPQCASFFFFGRGRGGTEDRALESMAFRWLEGHKGDVNPHISVHVGSSAPRHS